VFCIKGYKPFQLVFLHRTPLLCLLPYPHKADISNLPHKLQWSFKNALAHMDDLSVQFVIYNISFNSREYQKAKKLFFEPLGLSDNNVQQIEGVFNGTLLQSFVSEREKLSQRWKGPIFGKPLWVDRNESRTMKEKRSWTYKHYLTFVDTFEWNTEDEVPIIPLVHSTDYSTARNIVETGFASLSRLDQGFYGKGIYLTDKMDYAMIYVVTARKPSLIVSYVLVGNPYPVIENPRGPGGLLGLPIMASYDSHVVCVGYNGYPKKTFGQAFLEIVIDQEARVLPSFIVCLKKLTAQQLQAITALQLKDPPEGRITAISDNEEDESNGDEEEDSHMVALKTLSSGTNIEDY